MAVLLRGSQAKPFLKDLIHAATQIQEFSVYLTVGKIAKLSGSAAFDFGGGEFSDCEKELLEAVKRDPEDKYGWWTLRSGLYLIEYNEGLELPRGHIAVVQPWAQTAANGLSHPTRVLHGRHTTIHMPVTVSDVELHIKENARISELIVIKPAS